jgi:hypothetical protein
MFVSGDLIENGDDLGNISFSPLYCTMHSLYMSVFSTINLSHTASRERHFIPVTSLRAASCSSGTFSTKNGAIPVIETIIQLSSRTGPATLRKQLNAGLRIRMDPHYCWKLDPDQH